jgi:hypothetical protein
MIGQVQVTRVRVCARGWTLDSRRVASGELLNADSIRITIAAASRGPGATAKLVEEVCALSAYVCDEPQHVMCGG